MKQPNQALAGRSGHEPFSEQRLAVGGGNTPTPARRRDSVPTRSAAWTAAATSCAVLRVNDDVAAEAPPLGVERFVERVA
jgi:hypothetical protein